MNRKSMPLLAMKYAIGGIFFVGVWVWNEFASGHPYAAYHSESRSNVSDEVCNWQKLFSRPSHTCARVVGCGRPPAAKSFPGPRGGNKIEVSHERFNWPNKILSGESPSSMHFSGGLLCHALSPFVPTEFSVLADLIDGAVCAKHTFEASWFCRRPAQRGHISKVRVRGFCDTFRHRSGGENCVSIGRRTRGRAA